MPECKIFSPTLFFDQGSVLLNIKSNGNDFDINDICRLCVAYLHALGSLECTIPIVCNIITNKCYYISTLHIEYLNVKKIYQGNILVYDVLVRKKQEKQMLLGQCYNYSNNAILLKNHDVSHGIKNSSQMGGVPFVTKNQNLLIQGDNGANSGKKSENGVRTSTMLFDSKICVTWSSNPMMQSSKSRRTFFDSMVRMKSFGSELKAHFFEFVQF